MYVSPYKELLDKKLFIYFMQNLGPFTYQIPLGVQGTLEQPIKSHVEDGIKYLLFVLNLFPLILHFSVIDNDRLTRGKI